MKWIYKEKYSYEKRLAEASRIMNHYQDRVPVIVQRRPPIFSLWGNGQVSFKKYLAPRDLTLGEFYHKIREKASLNSWEALFFLVNNYQMPANSTTLGCVYKEFADDDNFLYISYTEEAKFG